MVRCVSTLHVCGYIKLTLLQERATLVWYLLTASQDIQHLQTSTSSSTIYFSLRLLHISPWFGFRFCSISIQLCPAVQAKVLNSQAQTGSFFAISETMTMKSGWTFLMLLLFLHQLLAVRTTASLPCRDGITTEDCLRVLTGQVKRGSPEQSLNPLVYQNLDWVGDSDESEEPTCKLRDIYVMIPDDCKAELLQILHLFVTHSTY
ncbi:uncharacterized protein LOC110978137 isoform X2 [Acanthaster planci]|uniref:Uncharacterized protein LOC110978137 isoform X2 n=1 Tax=Acanthaster planci TaxID=133434 RepID=A0A8B7Y5V4_ACAPL|nr:uncharacterized protein LOC110978137 isoform X2 [Acanthaster planci]